MRNTYCAVSGLQEVCEGKGDVRLTREESREQTRERLIESARDCVMRRGYDGTSIGDIAEAAGFTKGAVFSNFESKEALLLEVLRRHKARHVEAVEAVLQQPDCPLALQQYIDGLDRDSSWVLLDIELELQATRNPSFATRYRELERGFRVAMANVVAEVFRRSGRPPPAEPLQIASLLSSLVRGLVLASTANPEHPKVSHQVRLVIHSLFALAEKQAAP